eukprot:7387139-Prymnesium_polylepis.1
MAKCTSGCGRWAFAEGLCRGCVRELDVPSPQVPQSPRAPSPRAPAPAPAATPAVTPIKRNSLNNVWRQDRTTTSWATGDQQRANRGGAFDSPHTDPAQRVGSRIQATRDALLGGAAPSEPTRESPRKAAWPPPAAATP